MSGSRITLRVMVANLMLAAAKARLANRPDLALYSGTKSSEPGAPEAIPSLMNSDPSSWMQEAVHLGTRALSPAFGVPRRNHLHPKCPFVPPGHLGTTKWRSKEDPGTISWPHDVVESFDGRGDKAEYQHTEGAEKRETPREEESPEFMVLGTCKQSH